MGHHTVRCESGHVIVMISPDGPLQCPQLTPLRPLRQVKELDSYLCEGFGSGGQHRASGMGGRRSRKNSRDRVTGEARKCNVTVAVRVRPLSQRDMEMGARNVIVSMQGNRLVGGDAVSDLVRSGPGLILLSGHVCTLQHGHRGPDGVHGSVTAGEQVSPRHLVPWQCGASW